MDIILIISLVMLIITIILDHKIESKRQQLFEEAMDNYGRLINSQLKLEQIILNAEAKKELPFMTVEKIKKELFPDTQSDK